MCSRETLPNRDFHDETPEVDYTDVALAVFPPPSAGPYDPTDRVVLRAAASALLPFRLRALRPEVFEFVVARIGVDAPSAYYFHYPAGGLLDRTVPRARPTAAEAESESARGWCINWDLFEGGPLAPGRYLVIGTMDGHVAGPIFFRVGDPPASAEGTGGAGAGTRLDYRIERVPGGGSSRAGEPILLRGTVTPGPALAAAGDVAKRVVLLVATWERAHVPRPDAPPRAADEYPSPGERVPHNELTIVSLADAAGAKLPAAARGKYEARDFLVGGATVGGSFEVDLAQAAKIDRPGRYWVMITADGVVGPRLDFEVF